MLLVSGCARVVPVDPEGTLETVQAGTLRVGISPNSAFVEVENGTPRGSEVSIIEDFAEHLKAEPQWFISGEEQLVERLKNGEIDVVAGGITSKTPWSKEVGVTRPYATSVDAEGKETKLVFLVPPGENAFLSEFEHYLDETQEMP